MTTPSEARPVSVCLPTYNGAPYVRQAIDSVLAQEYPDFELIIVDDNSLDETFDIVASYRDSRIRLHRNQIRLGLVGNWNRCLRLFRGPYVTLFHQDDLMAPTNLGAKVATLQTEPTVGMVYSRVQLIDANGKELAVPWSTRDGETDAIEPGRRHFTDLMLGSNHICSPSVMFRREVLDRVGLFDRRLPYTADWEMWLRITYHYDVVYLARPLVSYRRHDANETLRFASDISGIRQTYRAKTIALGKLPLAPRERRRLRQGAAAGSAKLAVAQAERRRIEGRRGQAWQHLLYALWLQPSGLRDPYTRRVAMRLALGERATGRLLAVRKRLIS